MGDIALQGLEMLSRAESVCPPFWGLSLPCPSQPLGPALRVSSPVPMADASLGAGNVMGIDQLSNKWTISHLEPWHGQFLKDFHFNGLCITSLEKGTPGRTYLSLTCGEMGSERLSGLCKVPP